MVGNFIMKNETIDNTDAMPHAHDFHVPVMGTAFTIDTPYKVARFGISSVVSIGDDELCETMRKYYCEKHNILYTPISKETDLDYRALRISSYLDLLHELIQSQIKHMKSTEFEENSDNTKFFQLLKESHPMKSIFKTMVQSTGRARKELEKRCKDFIQAGAIDVNIMTKLDRDNFDKNNNRLSDMYSDAVSALRGFANSKINAGIVFSAGFNRRLFAYCEKITDFLYMGGEFKKRLILKVSDYRSSLIQGRFLAKKGIWVSEYRIESGLNCGGHAFATDGLLCGPILDEFKQNKVTLDNECRSICNDALKKNNLPIIPSHVVSKITYQGGIGTHMEQEFLMNEFSLAGTGWATPFLLVPEVTTLDATTRKLLEIAGEEDCYLSGISPLGVPFNTVKGTESEEQKKQRIDNGRPGSPCPKGYLISNTEFSRTPVCKASVFFQKRKIKQLKELNLMPNDYDEEFEKIVEKACLCEDLAAPALIEYNLSNKRPLKSTVCAGPNIAYFNKISTLREMVDHIYGRINLMADPKRPHFFVAELSMYINYFKKELKSTSEKVSKIDIKRLTLFAKNLQDGIQYYLKMVSDRYPVTNEVKGIITNEIISLNTIFQNTVNLYPAIFQSQEPISVGS